MARLTAAVEQRQVHPIVISAKTDAPDDGFDAGRRVLDLMVGAQGLEPWTR
jgi:hypothetical protein